MEDLTSTITIERCVVKIGSVTPHHNARIQRYHYIAPDLAAMMLRCHEIPPNLSGITQRYHNIAPDLSGIMQRYHNIAPDLWYNTAVCSGTIILHLIYGIIQRYAVLP